MGPLLPGWTRAEQPRPCPSSHEPSEFCRLSKAFPGTQICLRPGENLICSSSINSSLPPSLLSHALPNLFYSVFTKHLAGPGPIQAVPSEKHSSRRPCSPELANRRIYLQRRLVSGYNLETDEVTSGEPGDLSDGGG